MKNFLSDLFACCKLKRGYLIFLILCTAVSIILGVWIGINIGGNIDAIDLNNIVYVRFLKNETSFIYLILGTLLSLAIFFAIILLCSSKAFLLPLAVLFYMYLVYSQALVFVSLILIYGFFNCIILCMFLLVYLVVLFVLFLLAMCEMCIYPNQNDYFSCCCNFGKSHVLLNLLLITTLVVLFSVILVILKSYIILLVY